MGFLKEKKGQLFFRLSFNFNPPPFAALMLFYISSEAAFEVESKKKEIKRSMKWAEMLGAWNSKKCKSKV